jgi:hypothetical protein
VVPVIIHLWNVKKGKTLKVGSIAFFRASAKSHAKRLRLSEWLLLLLRCLLLIVLSITIAKPYYNKKMGSQQQKGWFLVEEAQVKQAYTHFKPTIDSLQAAGFSFHYFNPECKEAKFEEAILKPADTTSRPRPSYWSLLTLLEKKVPPGLPVYLFTDNRLSRYTGSRPSVSLKLKWNIFPSPDTISNWIEKAYKLKNDSLRIVMGKSTPAATTYTYQNIAADAPGQKFTVRRTNGKLVVDDLSGRGSRQTVLVDTSLRITIYSKDMGIDATYLKAAIDAIRDFSKYPIDLSIGKTIKSIPARHDWLFWLSEETIPDSLIQNSVFKYEKGKLENRSSRMFAEDLIAGITTEDIPVFKTITPDPTAPLLTTTWQNSFGQPILTVEKHKAAIYRFYSRFDPKWNNLTWSSQFPGLIYTLLFHNRDQADGPSDLDKRIIDATQILPLGIAAVAPVLSPEAADKKDLSKLFWTIAFILFALERIIALAAKKEVHNG